MACVWEVARVYEINYYTVLSKYSVKHYYVVYGKYLLSKIFS